MYTIIKASGSELLPQNFQHFCDFIRSVQSEEKQVILVFGGGVQIDEAYAKQFEKERPKKDGMGITTKEVLEYAVMPVYNQNFNILQNAFPAMHMVHFENVIGNKNEEFGKVIIPKKISITKNHPFQAIGFLGLDENNEPCNVNADDIVQLLCEQENIKEVIFLTLAGGIRNNDNEIIPFLSEKDVSRLLQDTYLNAKITDGMIKKCKVIHHLLQHIPKAVILSSKNPLVQTVCKALPAVLPVYASRTTPFVRGKGSYLFTEHGEKYLDMMSGVAVNILGHSDDDWINVVVAQLKKCTHISNYYISEPQQELAKKLVELSFADQVFFSNSGTEANEAALKFAKKYGNQISPEKTEIIAFKNGFHGRSMGSLSATENPNYRLPFAPLIPNITFCKYNDEEAFINTISTNTATVIVEPIQGEGGVFSASKNFLQTIRKQCDKYNALLIFDEVQCGLGRSGTLFAYEQFDVIPDILTLAKPLAGGVPIGATLVKGAVGRHIKKGDHGSTFGGNPLACASALHILKRLENPQFLQQVRENSVYLLEKLRKINSPIIKEVRGMGLLVGIECTQKVQSIIDKAYSEKLLIISAGENVVRLLPPLNISKAEIDEACGILQLLLGADCND